MIRARILRKKRGSLSFCGVTTQYGAKIFSQIKLLAKAADYYENGFNDKLMGYYEYSAHLADAATASAQATTFASSF